MRTYKHLDINLYGIVENGYGGEATLITHGETVGECIVNSSLEYIGNNGEEYHFKGPQSIQELDIETQIKVIDLIVEEYNNAR